jgi:hydroquinone glucosyltransferase
MITWPLFGEQRMNSKLVTEGLKVGLKVKFDDSSIADSNEIVKVIRALMLSEERIEIQQRIEELKDAATNALEKDGSSSRALSQFGIPLENLML